MDSARWERIQSVFHQVLELPKPERRASMASACGGDAELMAEVDAMLHADEEGTSLLDRGLPQIAHQVLSMSAGPESSHEFGPYRLKEMLGEGGMGVVWLAERMDAGNLVAIKFLLHAGLSPARRERFTQEITTLAKLKHPLIARLYDAGTLADGTPWFAMEYVKGIRLTDYCRKHELTTEDRLRLFRSICEAVQYAHGQEIIHRDLKPSNILVDEEGVPRLLDFGVAREIHSLDDPKELTRPGLRFVSPDYAAPEWMRDGKVGFYTDVYSRGVILYEMLAGKRPSERLQPTSTQDGTPAFRDSEEPLMVSSHLTDEQNAGAGVWRLTRTKQSDLDVLCAKAMHKDSQARYQSVEALIREIDHYLKREPLEARPATFRYRLGRFISRNQRAFFTTSLLVTLVVGLIIFFTVRLAKERSRTNREAAIAAAMNRFLTDLLAQSDPLNSGLAKESLVDAVGRASPQIDLQFRSEPLLAARLHETIAKALDDRSDYSPAREEYDRAGKLFVQAEGSLSQDAVLARLQRADMEVRSNEPGSIAVAQSVLKDAEVEISRITKPRPELAVRILSTRGVIAIFQGDGRAANEMLTQALSQAQSISGFDESTLLQIKQRLGFTYIRLRDGAKAEALFRVVVEAYSKTGGPDDPKALSTRVNLLQALLTERKYPEIIKEANLLYPTLVTKLGEDHRTSINTLAVRATAEGYLNMWDEAIRDDLTVYKLFVRKQGLGSGNAIGVLSDAALSQCRAGRYAEGEVNARKAYQEARQAFGPHAGLTEGSAYSLAICLIGMNQLDEASGLLQSIDVGTVTQLSGDSTVGGSVALAQAEIAVRRRDYVLAGRYIQEAAPKFESPEANVLDRQELHRLKNAINSHLPASK